MKRRVETAVVLAGLILAGSSSAETDPSHVSVPLVSPSRQIALAVEEAARRFGLPEPWLWAVIRVESFGNARAVSPKGALGLMQLMPATWAEISAELRLIADPFDVRANVLAGAAYLRRLFDRYGAVGMVAAYNAGPSRWEAYALSGRALPRETIHYVAQLALVIGYAAPPSLASRPELVRPEATLFADLTGRAFSAKTDAPPFTTRRVRSETSALFVSAHPLPSTAP